MPASRRSTAALPPQPRGRVDPTPGRASWDEACASPSPAGSLQTGRSAGRAGSRSRPSARLRASPAGTAPAPSFERLRKTPLDEQGGEGKATQEHGDYFCDHDAVNMILVAVGCDSERRRRVLRRPSVVRRNTFRYCALRACENYVRSSLADTERKSPRSSPARPLPTAASKPACALAQPFCASLTRARPRAVSCN